MASWFIIVSFTTATFNLCALKVLQHKFEFAVFNNVFFLFFLHLSLHTGGVVNQQVKLITRNDIIFKCLHWVLVSVDKSRAEKKVQVLSKLWQRLILFHCFVSVCSIVSTLISLICFCWWIWVVFEPSEEKEINDNPWRAIQDSSQKL